MSEQTVACACGAEATEEQLMARLEEVLKEYRDRPGALIPVLAARSQVTPSDRVMFPVACRSIWEKPVKAELTFKLSALGELVDVTVPDPALPVPLLPSVMLTGSISSPPPRLPALAWPSITELMAVIPGAEISTTPPAPPCAPPATLMVEVDASLNLLPDWSVTLPPGLAPCAPPAAWMTEEAPRVRSSPATS